MNDNQPTLVREKCEEELVGNEPRPVQYTIKSGGYVPVGATVKKLPANAYTITYVSGEIVFVKQTLNTDELFIFEDNLSERVMDEVDRFWTKTEIFKSYKFVHKRGFLLFGPQGSGKTSIVHQIITNVINRQGVCFLADSPEYLEDGLRSFRLVEPDRPVVCVFEDIDDIIKIHDEAILLKLLDGESQIDHVVNIATTNYPEELDKRIAARPRRFDTVLRIEMPKEEVRKAFLLRKLNLEKSTKEVDLWVKDSEGLSFAALAELIIAVKCLDLPYKTTLEKLKFVELSKKEINSIKELGFISR